MASFERRDEIDWRNRLSVYRYTDAPEPLWLAYGCVIRPGPPPRGPVGRKGYRMKFGRPWMLFLPLSEAERAVAAGSPGAGVTLVVRGRADSWRGEEASLGIAPIHHETFLRYLKQAVISTKRAAKKLAPGGSMELTRNEKSRWWRSRVRVPIPSR